MRFSSARSRRVVRDLIEPYLGIPTAHYNRSARVLTMLALVDPPPPPIVSPIITPYRNPAIPISSARTWNRPRLFSSCSSFLQSPVHHSLIPLPDVFLFSYILFLIFSSINFHPRLAKVKRSWQLGSNTCLLLLLHHVREFRGRKFDFDGGQV